MREYEFLTTWCLDAPIERVFDVLRDSRGYPRWWKGVKSVVALADGDPEGVGEASRFTWRSVLPYELSFDSRVTRVERPHLIEGTATGELEGTGRLRVARPHDARVDERARSARPPGVRLEPRHRDAPGRGRDRARAGRAADRARLSLY
jgi:uncharacterized membrane protein